MSEPTTIEQYARWLHDEVYHARVVTVRRWMERSDGAAPVELLSYAMDAVDDLDRLEDGLVMKGWECPKCGTVNAPWKETCGGCKPRPPAFPTDRWGKNPAWKDPRGA